MDETHIRKLIDETRLATLVGGEVPAKEMADEEEHKTSCMFINAAGDHFPSTVILPLVNIPPIADDVERYFDFTNTPKGWIDGETCKTMIEEVFVRRIEKYREDKGLQGQYMMLVLDNHSSRNYLDIEKLETEHKIIIMFIPPHSSHLLQPLDLGPNKTLKDLYSKLYNPKYDDNMNQKRNKSLWALRLAESHAISEYTIIYSWAKAGLWPINPEAVTKRSMVKPEMNSTISRKRRRKMERGDVMINGSTIVHHGRADKENVIPSNKKTPRKRAPKMQKLV